MSFASNYIEKRILFPQFICEAPDNRTEIIVVIPSYGEADIVRLLNSLVSASSPECKVEVLVVVNSPANASSDSLNKNRKTLEDIESWKQQAKNCWFRLFSLDIKPGAIPGWGVGLARKTGMDEAVRRFGHIENPDGIIVNLDADCRVEPNYFSAIFREFNGRKERKACSIYFEHELEGNEFHDSIYTNIILYELHLRYYFQALRYAGFPYVFHTVGSAMAVRAGEYVSVGGMNRRQAGEDFYLIQKLVPSGGYFSLNSTTVYPSSRPSFRVPFGTGAAIAKMADESGSAFLTYNIQAFEELRIFFSKTDLLYNSKKEDIIQLYSSIPEGIKRFADELEWIGKVNEIRENTSGLSSFRKRFFGWFNMFRIVRYLNTVHQDMFSKVPVEDAANDLLTRIGMTRVSDGPRNILLNFRRMERDN